VAPRACDAPVSSHDLYPTLLRAAGVAPRHPLTALDLGAALDEKASRTLVAENNRNDAMVRLFGGRFAREFQTVTDGRWKLILTDQGEVELFDLGTDPAESVNLAADEPRRVAEYKARLERFRSSQTRYPSEGRASLSPEEAARLRSLGYLQ
jgi:arylsulfatase A-like enzyme